MIRNISFSVIFLQKNTCLRAKHSDCFLYFVCCYFVFNTFYPHVKQLNLYSRLTLNRKPIAPYCNNYKITVILYIFSESIYRNELLRFFGTFCFLLLSFFCFCFCCILFILNGFCFVFIFFIIFFFCYSIAMRFSKRRTQN